MVMIGMFMLGVSAIYLLAIWRKWAFIGAKWFRFLVVLGGPLSIVAIEAGWWLAEVGRQPWILRGYMTTAEGATTSDSVEWMLVMFSILYIILGIGSVVTLHRIFKNNSIEKEIAARSSKGEV
jgi:cytochrome d ubiquinol oxidase subunit I